MGKLHEVEEWIASGIPISVLNSWGSDKKKWSDGKLRLEEQLSRIAAGFIRLALADRTETQKRFAQS